MYFTALTRVSIAMGVGSLKALNALPVQVTLSPIASDSQEELCIPNSGKFLVILQEEAESLVVLEEEETMRRETETPIDLGVRHSQMKEVTP